MTKRTSNVSDNLYDIHYANGLWVAVGGGGAITTSGDGETWTKRTSNVSDNLYNVHYANGLWVAVGGGEAITTSGDGETWTKRTSNVNTPNFVFRVSTLGGKATGLRSRSERPEPSPPHLKTPQALW